MCVFTMFSYNQKFNTKSLYKGLCLFVVAFMMFAPRVILADSAKFTRAEANYDISDVTVIRQDGAKLLFNQVQCWLILYSLHVQQFVQC